MSEKHTCAKKSARALKSRFSLQHWLTSALETMGVGGVAAVIAYSLGELLKQLV